MLDKTGTLAEEEEEKDLQLSAVQRFLITKKNLYLSNKNTLMWG